MPVITIRVSGGVVQNVEDIPPGIVVRVIDYDVDGADTADLDEDETGEDCNIALWSES